MMKFIEIGTDPNNAIAIRANQIAYMAIVPKEAYEKQYRLQYWLKGNSQIFQVTFDSAEARAELYNSILKILKDE